MEERARFEIKLSPVGRYYFVFRSKEGMSQVVSPSFMERSLLEKCIAGVREIAPFAQIMRSDEGCGHTEPPFFLVEGGPVGFVFSLKGFDGEYILSSEGYDMLANALDAIHSLKEESHNAMIIDHT